MKSRIIICNTKQILLSAMTFAQKTESGFNCESEPSINLVIDQSLRLKPFFSNNTLKTTKYSLIFIFQA